MVYQEFRWNDEFRSVQMESHVDADENQNCNDNRIVTHQGPDLKKGQGR